MLAIVFSPILKKNKLEVQSIYLDTISQIEKLRKITSVKEIKHESGSPDRYVLNPTSKELMKMLKKNIFIKSGTFEKIPEN